MIAEHLARQRIRVRRAHDRQGARDGHDAHVFVNASGLPDDEPEIDRVAISSILSRRLIPDFPQFYPYFRLQSFYWNGRSFEGHNNLLKFFDGADGLKTGYTRMSGFNLASSATRQGKRLVAVVMGGRSARDRDIQTAELLESEFTQLGLGRPAPVIMAMSPLVLDDEEAAASEEPDSASGQLGARARDARARRTSSARPDTGPPACRRNAPSTPRSRRARARSAKATSAIRVAPAVPASHGQWGIQVGAHLARDKAETQLRQVLQQCARSYGQRQERHRRTRRARRDLLPRPLRRLHAGQGREPLRPIAEARHQLPRRHRRRVGPSLNARASLPIAVR